MNNKTFNFSDFLNEKHDKEKDEEKKSDSVDTITMEVPLFIRMLEFAKEDAKNDIDLHKVTENALKLSKKNDKLSMTNYDDIINCKEEDIKKDDDKKDKDKKDKDDDKKDKDDDKKDKKDK